MKTQQQIIERILLLQIQLYETRKLFELANPGSLDQISLISTNMNFLHEILDTLIDFIKDDKN